MMRINLTKAFAFIILSILTLAMVVLLFSGCTTPRKAGKCYDKNRPKALEYCVSRFPPRDSISEVIRYLQGEVIVDTIDNSHTDTFVTEHTNIKYRTVVKYKTITKTKTDTVYTDKFITQTDTKAQELLQSAKTLIVAKDKQLHQRTRIAFWLALSWLLFILGLLVRALWFNRLNRG